MRRPTPNFEQEWLKRVVNNFVSRQKIHRISSDLPSLQLSIEFNQQAPNDQTSPPPVPQKKKNIQSLLPKPVRNMFEIVSPVSDHFVPRIQQRKGQ
ncbi:hypothetical protein AVEN_84065-1 [Araneus ventricosus]|uniref:Uncharacterized protein n=1 Tax=Araneus ventricosus TaxID=182803 RepID=A0A4Y2DT65_ARAVE|nr:hypothetical protein AVEN_22370-1 [Araneus ventricosus]GBM18904.1 hypothetical protein AVEN_84065-1 [Araneus ventricosus]